MFTATLYAIYAYITSTWTGFGSLTEKPIAWAWGILVYPSKKPSEHPCSVCARLWMCLNWSKTSKEALGVFQDSGHQSKCFRIWICLVKSFERMSMMLLLKNAGWRWLDVAGAAEVLNWVGECSLQVQQEHGTNHNSQHFREPWLPPLHV